MTGSSRKWVILALHDFGLLNQVQDKFYIVTQLATGGELFDRICEQGKFTEKDGSQTIKQVIQAVDYLHGHNVVHRGMFPQQLSPSNFL